MTAARLPQAWVEVLNGLRTDELPEGEVFPLDLSPIEDAAVAGVSDPRGWEALKAFHARREPLEVTAERWNIPRERVRQLGLRALQQLASHAHSRGWAAQVYELAQVPRAVVIPPEVEEAWPILALAALSRHTPDLRTVRLRGDLWALFVCPDWHLAPRRRLDAPQFHAEAEAAQVLGLPAEVLRVAWPSSRLGVRRTRDGRYAPLEDHWKAAAWLNAVVGALAEAGHTTWGERLLFTAVRSLPGVPDVQDSTLRGALRRGPAFERTPLPGVWHFRGAQEPEL